MERLLQFRLIRTIRITSRMWIQIGKGTKMRRWILCAPIGRRDTVGSAKRVSTNVLQVGKLFIKVKNCPKLKDRMDNAPVRNKLVHHMNTISGISAQFPFHFGSIHSFMPYSLSRKLGLKLRELDPPLIVSTPKVDRQVGAILTHLPGKSIVCEFAIYHLGGIDIILEMDWLSRTMPSYCATKECHYQERISIGIIDILPRRWSSEPSMYNVLCKSDQVSKKSMSRILSQCGRSLVFT